MKNQRLSFLFLILSNSVFAQHSFTKLWDYRYGGSKSDNVHGLLRASDGGFLVGGASASCNDGDVTENNHDPSCTYADFWVVKVDTSGMKQWDRRFGGDNNEYSRSIIKTRDDGYLLAGYTDSDMSGDMSEFSNGGFDYWIIKIDSTGNKMWDKRLGGNSSDCLSQVIQTSDGGFLLAGDSYSDSSGDRSQSSRGREDYWIVKTDSIGNKVWDKRFGCNGSDILTSVCQAPDGGYMLLGTGNQGTCQDKPSPGWGASDFWVIRTDSLGNMLWEKSYGGTMDENANVLIKTHDNGFILGGISRSGIGGVKTSAYKGLGDWWVVKIDSVGNVVWDKDFGGLRTETVISSIYETGDNGLIISGSSRSDSCTDKSENNLGDTQSWIIKTDANGNKLWDKTLFTYGGFSWTPGCFTLPVENDGYVSVSSENGGIGGYKTQPNWDGIDSTFDYWIIKMHDNDPINSIKDNHEISPIVISPQPAIDQIELTIYSKIKDNSTIRIYNLLGELQYQTFTKSETVPYKLQIDIKEFLPGLYILVFETPTGFYNSRFIKL